MDFLRLVCAQQPDKLNMNWKGAMIYMEQRKQEEKVIMLTIKEAAALVEGLTEYRVRQMCIRGQIPCIMAGRKYLINQELFLRYLRNEPA